jgi:hypothetical protein
MTERSERDPVDAGDAPGGRDPMPVSEDVVPGGGDEETSADGTRPAATGLSKKWPEGRDRRATRLPVGAWQAKTPSGGGLGHADTRRIGVAEDAV